MVRKIGETGRGSSGTNGLTGVLRCAARGLVCAAGVGLCVAAGTGAVGGTMARAQVDGREGKAGEKVASFGAARQKDGKGGPMGAPEMSPAVLRLLEAGYLTAEEGKDLRISHGVWRAADLDTGARRGRAALIDGRWDDAALAEAGEGAQLDRAEALLLRGQLGASARVLDGMKEQERVSARDGARWALLRARVHEERGENAKAVEVAEGAFARFGKDGAGGEGAPKGAALVDAVMLVELHLRLKGPEAVARGAGGEGAALAEVGQNFDGLMQALARVRDTEKLYWPARLAEAELLLSRDNPAQAQGALTEVLSLNPRCARAWELLGRMTVNSFSFEATEGIAVRLERLLEGKGAGTEGAEETAEAGEGAEGEAGGGRVSALAQMLRARASLRQTNGEIAEELLLRVPEEERSMECRALIAASAAVRFEFDRAARLLTELDAYAGAEGGGVGAGGSPGTVRGYLEVGSALSEARQYAESAKFLEEASRRQPFNPQPLAERGLMELQAGRDAPALAALERAFALDPFNVRADNSLRLVRELQGYARAESPHFVVRYHPGVDGVLAEEMLPALEEMYAIVTGSAVGGIDFQPPGVDNKGKTVIDLMPDHEWFGVRIAGMPQIHTIAASTGPVIAMEAPREGPGHLGTYDWIRTVRHEFTHTVSLARTKNRIPLWFTEAAAQYLEFGPKDFQTVQLLSRALDTEALFDFAQINISFVRPKKPSDRAQGYAQGLWMYEFIIERFGAKAPLALMDAYGRGVREEEAFREVLGVSRDEFMAEFVPWAKGQVVKWGMELPDGTPRVKELLAEGALRDPTRLKDVMSGLRESAEAAGLAAAGSAGSGTAGDDVGAEGTGPGGWEFDPGPITPEMLAAWAERFPRHPEVLQLLVADALEVSGGKATAENAPLLERYAEARPVDPMPHRLLAQWALASTGGEGNASTDEAMVRRAIGHLEFLDVREQYTPTYAMELARRYAGLKEWAPAKAKALRAVSIAPYDPRPRELAATICVQTGDYTGAERQIVALTWLEPDREIHRKRLEAVRGKAQGK